MVPCPSGQSPPRTPFSFCDAALAGIYFPVRTRRLGCSTARSVTRLSKRVILSWIRFQVPCCVVVYFIMKHIGLTSLVTWCWARGMTATWTILWSLLTLLYSCILFSWYTAYFMASMHCVLLINLIHVFSYGLQCTTYKMNYMYTLYHVRMTVSRAVTVPNYDLWLRVMLRHRHALHKVLARRTLDGN